MTARAAVSLVAALVLVAGCGGDDSGDGGGANGAVVMMEADGFSPATLTVESGETVTFENTSDDDRWPASNVHPTHELYPEFDAKKAVLPGESYSFTFERVGSWGYHDHLNPGLGGTITVE
jgi:plastocyanin